MIQETKGNLLESDAQALVNTVNTVGVMGKGIALQFKENFPDNYKEYRAACKRGDVKIGKMFITTENSINGKKIIINFPTKTTWRKPSEYSYIENGLADLRNVILNYNITSIAIPPLGSHNGGLDWQIVKKMIVDKLNDLDCTIYLYEPSDEISEKLKSERVKLTPARAMMLDVLCDMVNYGEFISVFAAEKVVYFLERLGAANIFNIQFVKYYYGPYSKGKIAHVLYYLNGSYIKGMSGMQARPFDHLWLIDGTRETVQEYLGKEENKKYKDISNTTKAFLRGYYSSYSMELLATVDFILRNDLNLKNWKSQDQDKVAAEINEDITSWSKRKEKMFYGSRFLPITLKHLSELSY